MNKEKIVDYYDRMWADRTAGRGVSATLRQRRIMALIRKYMGRNDLRILDLGCGKGLLTEALSRFGSVTGVDYARKTIEANRKRAPDLEFICADITDQTLPIHLGKYDLVVSSEVIEHIPIAKRDIFLQNVASVLDTEGIFILSTPYRETLLRLKPPDVSAEAFLSSIDDQPIDNIMSRQELLGLLQTRFEVLELTSVQPLVKNRLLDLLWKGAFWLVDYRLVNRITDALHLDGKYNVIVCRGK